jgi:hypothetical protein
MPALVRSVRWGRSTRWSRSVRWGLVSALALAAALLPSSANPVQAAPGDPVQVAVLSNRADLVSGGDALVQVTAPAGTESGLHVDVDGRDVSSAFAARPDGRILGLVTGLALGPNVVTAQLQDGRGARLTITNHPIGGPVFSGPQIQPWTCAAGAADAQCNRPPAYAFKYISTNPTKSGFQDYNPDSPPSDVATTTTDQGKTVPFIVRTETGTIDRDQYRIAVLFDPAKPWTAAEPQPQFNHKLVITHGASCDTSYAEGSAPDVMNKTALGRGFATMSNALDNAGHNCNIVTQAESLIMTKEHLADTYGDLRYTIGSGCSGGSLVQQQIANAYPGVYQGITPQCSYPDAWSSAMQYEDYHLLRDYFEHPEKWGTGVAWEEVTMSGVTGHPNPSNPYTFTTVIPDSGKPTRSCPGVPADKVYNAATNPTGVRCTLADYMVNVFGRRAEDGFARVPWDNTGVQYGLKALKAGTLTAQQFVDVNTKIGGRDIDHNPTAARIAADPEAIGIAYRSGAVNVTNNLDETAIIDLRGPDPGAFHDVYRTYALRERLVREHGDADNQLIWRGPVVLLGDATYVDQSIIAMDKWLAAVEADHSDTPLAEKLIKDRPADVTDRCANGDGVEMPTAFCDGIVQRYSTPRIEATMPTTDDVLKCALKPLDPADYAPATLTADQVAALQTAFPTGVCDYAKPSVAAQGTVVWLDYSGGPGGMPMGAAPQSVALGVAAADTGRGDSLPATGGRQPLTAAFLALAAFALLRAGRRRASA